MEDYLVKIRNIPVSLFGEEFFFLTCDRVLTKKKLFKITMVFNFLICIKNIMSLWVPCPRYFVSYERFFKKDKNIFAILFQSTDNSYCTVKQQNSLLYENFQWTHKNCKDLCVLFSWLTLQNENVLTALYCVVSQPVLAQRSISIPPANVRKPKFKKRFFDVFCGIEMKHWVKLA